MSKKATVTLVVLLRPKDTEAATACALELAKCQAKLGLGLDSC